MVCGDFQGRRWMQKEPLPPVCGGTNRPRVGLGPPDRRHSERSLGVTVAAPDVMQAAANPRVEESPDRQTGTGQRALDHV